MTLVELHPSLTAYHGKQFNSLGPISPCTTTLLLLPILFLVRPF
uniref:Uncharacterized protein n=1 Tax=Utricularia reniformis TaxID=192314 RepID=A0A1Y0B1S7_9LAMI|nr:hypothetical protein AEK19_MT1125 [Utricularia reniformis]ART31341.1 hypothetical protein AEK19_MT1125 [Utricularia reniformis]